MQDRPTAAEAVEAVAAFLEGELMPELEGAAGFQVRVAANLLAIVARELRLGPGLDREERSRLEALLGGEGELAELNRELAARLRSGELDDSSEALLSHLRLTARARLEVASPGLLKDSTD
ncbi:MAG TPA: DUF6285 domain-containing protein [Solirubrobacterales bacterium]|jgi:hypothetical protein